MNEFYKNENISDDLKSNIAFQTTVAVRDTLSLSLSNIQNPTYEQSIDIIHDIDPVLTDLMLWYLGSKNESDIVSLYKEEAKLLSLKHGSEIKPEALIKAEIARLEDILRTLDGLKSKDTKLTKRRIGMLNAALKNLQPRKFTENMILQHDFSLMNRLPELISKENGYNYRDYTINDSNSLRLRLLHPDQPEHIKGADLIYEHHNTIKNKVRIILLQYKIWENGKISIQDGSRNLEQIKRLYKSICENNFCSCKSEPDSEISFRFPYCAAFYRPTDKYQVQKDRMVSSGLHLPICEVLKMQLENTHKIVKSEVKHSSVNQYLFEKLFSLGLIGSDWMEYDEVESFYRKSKVLQSEDSIKIYASNFTFSADQAKTNDLENYVEEEPPF